MPARMKVFGCARQAELQPGQPATGNGDRRFLDAPHAAIGRDDEVGSQQTRVRPDERLQAGAADLLFSFEHELDVHRQRALRRKERLRDLDRLKDRAFVVRYAAGVEAAIADRRRERRADPLLQWIGRLYVVMTVDQHGGLARRAEPLGEDNRMAAGRDDLHVERAGGCDLTCDPGRGAVNVPSMGRISADTGDGCEFDQLREGAIAMRSEIAKGCLCHGIAPNGVCHFPPSIEITCPLIHPA